ncbi:hypothetical protein Z043-105332 [Arapaima gigas]
MEKVRRILVHLSKENTAPQCAQFVQSITGHFSSCHQDQVQVDCCLDNNRFIVYGQSGGSGPGVLLKRASFCPFKHLSESEVAALPPEVRGRGVDLGVAVLLQSANRRLLLTRRAAGLRIFPNVWVPPGRTVVHMDLLLDAGLRELREETGLKLNSEDISSQLLGLWESVYPPMLSRGLPQRHHIVTYVLLHTSLTHLQLQAALRPEPAEVSGCLWVDAEIVKAIVSAVDGEEDAGTLPTNVSRAVSVAEVSPDGRLRESLLPLSILCNRAPAEGEDVERVSTGTKFALELWLKTLDPQKQHSGYEGGVSPAGAMIWQQPRSLRVAAGANITLTCNIAALPMRCSSVRWLHMWHTGSLSLYNRSHSEAISVPSDYKITDKACLLHIFRTSLSDAGTFYCTLDNTGMIELGNGTTLTVSESDFPETTIEIFVPGPQGLNLSKLVTLMCLVSGVDLSLASVSWAVDGRTVTPAQPELCVHGPVQARDSLRTWLSVPDHMWARGTAVTCVLETTTGLCRNSTVKRVEESESSSPCVLYTVGGLCYTTFTMILFAMIVAGVITVPSLDMSACRQTPADPSETQYATVRYEGEKRQVVPFI